MVFSPSRQCHVVFLFVMVQINCPFSHICRIFWFGNRTKCATVATLGKFAVSYCSFLTVDPREKGDALCCNFDSPRRLEKFLPNNPPSFINSGSVLKIVDFNFVKIVKISRRDPIVKRLQRVRCFKVRTKSRLNLSIGLHIPAAAYVCCIMHFGRFCNCNVSNSQVRMPNELFSCLFGRIVG